MSDETTEVTICQVNRRGRPRDYETNSGIPHEGVPRPRNADAPLSIREEIQRYLREELSQYAEQEGYGSFDDEDDFEEEDPDVLPLTHHEVIAMSDEELQDYALDAGIELTSEAPASKPAEVDAMPEALSGDGSEVAERPSKPPSPPE